MSNTYTQTESIRLRHFTIRLDSHVTSQLNSQGVTSRKSTSGMTNRQQGKRCMSNRSIESNRQHFQPTLHSPPKDKIRDITIHEPSSFLKHGHKLQSICTIHVDSIFNPPSKSRSNIFSKSRTNRLPACRINRRGNDSCRFDVRNRVHESISGSSNRKYQRRIDSSWVYWTTLRRVGAGGWEVLHPSISDR